MKNSDKRILIIQLENNLTKLKQMRAELKDLKDIIVGKPLCIKNNVLPFVRKRRSA